MTDYIPIHCAMCDYIADTPDEIRRHVDISHKGVTDTPNRPADEPELDEILDSFRDWINHHDAGTSGMQGELSPEEAKTALLRWRTAEVRAVLERLKAIDNPDTVPDDYEALVRLEVAIDAELQKLQEEER